MGLNRGQFNNEGPLVPNMGPSCPLPFILLTLNGAVSPGAASINLVVLPVLLSLVATTVEGQAPSYTLDNNEDIDKGIYVVVLQGNGYASEETSSRFNGTITENLYSYTLCHRF